MAELSAKSNKTAVTVLSIVSGLLIILGAWAIYAYNKAKKEGRILPPLAGTLAGAGIPAPKRTTATTMLQPGVRIKKGTLVQLPDGTVKDLFDLVN